MTKNNLAEIVRETIPADTVALPVATTAPSVLSSNAETLPATKLEERATADIHDLHTSLTTAFSPEPASLAPEPTSFAPTPPPAIVDKPTNPSKPRRNRRILKTIVGAGLLTVFGLIPAYALWQPSSVEAVLNARLVTLRAPIAGQIAATTVGPLSSSAMVPDTKLIQIHNDRADRNRLDDLVHQMDQIELERDALDARLRYAQSEEADLSHQISLFNKARAIQLDVRKDEMIEQIGIARLRHEEARAAAERAQALARGGNLPGADLERATRAVAVAGLEERTLQHRLASLENEQQAARAGVFVGDASNNDRPASVQRLETVRSQIAELATDQKRAQSQITRIEAQIKTEAAHVDLQANAVLTTPVQSRMWEQLVSPGEDVTLGQPLVRLIDCSSTVITANVTESVYNDLTLGMTGRFIPADGGNEIKARITNLTGFANAAANYAIEPSSLMKQPYRVTLELTGAQTGPACLVGRTGRIAFDNASSFF